MPDVSVRVHVLDADPALAPFRSALAAAAEAALERIRARLPVRDVDVVIQRDPFAVIPELGVGDSCPSAHLVRVSVDPEHAAFDEVLDGHLSRTLAHELHHCARWRGPGYGTSLGEALMSEGLADHFDLEVRPGARPYHWTQVLDGARLHETWKLARPRLWEPGYDHGFWFFNTGAEGPPFHAGYSLGFHLVRAFLASDPEQRPSGLATVPARRILEGLTPV